MAINYNGLNVTNFEMESAGIYGLASILGHEALSINLILANRKTGAFSDSPGEAVKKFIAKGGSVILIEIMLVLTFYLLKHLYTFAAGEGHTVSSC